MYFDYEMMKLMIEDFKENRKNGMYQKLFGFYIFSHTEGIQHLDVFKQLGDDHEEEIDENTRNSLSESVIYKKINNCCFCSNGSRSKRYIM